MKRLLYLISLTLVLVSCGTRSGYFKLEGRLLNLNQGEFYIYSPDGVIDGIDTIKVEGGRFTYQTRCKEIGTLVIIYPNLSEQPVFTQSGKTATVKGDASHLKEIQVKGTKENDLMNGFRQRLAKATPPEELEYAEQFILDNPKSLCSVYVLSKYFAINSKADLDKSLKLAETVQKAQPNNSNVARILRYIKIEKNGESGANIPSFSAKDIDGKIVTGKELKGKVAVVFTWAAWNYESRNIRDKLNRLKYEYGNKLVLMAINLDPSQETCKQIMERDSTSTVTICDQMMFDNPLLDKFGLGHIPDNIIFNAQGHVIERGLDVKELETKLRNILN